MTKHLDAMKALLRVSTTRSEADQAALKALITQQTELGDKARRLRQSAIVVAPVCEAPTPGELLYASKRVNALLDASRTATRAAAALEQTVVATRERVSASVKKREAVKSLVERLHAEARSRRNAYEEAALDELRLSGD